MVEIKYLSFRPWVYFHEFPEGYKPQKMVERQCEVCGSIYIATKTSKKNIRRYCSINCSPNPKKVKYVDRRLKPLPLKLISRKESEEMLFWQTVEVVMVTKYEEVWKQKPGKRAYNKILKDIEELKKKMPDFQSEGNSMVPINSNILEPVGIELTPGLQELLIKQIQIGVSVDMAAKFCGILPTTVRTWMMLGIEQGPGSKYYDFVVEVNRVQATTQRAISAKFLKYVLDPDKDPDWRAYPQALKTFFKEEFGTGSAVDNRIQTTINTGPVAIVTSEQLNGASPEYKNMVIKKARESMGLPSSVYDHSKKAPNLNVTSWLEEEAKEKAMEEELNLDDLD